MFLKLVVKHARRRHHAGPGFTLIELLTLVGIVAVLATIALTSYSGFIERARLVQMTVDMGAMSALIGKFQLDNKRYPDSLAEVRLDGMRDVWGRPYAYISHDEPGGRGQWRKDHNIVPINSDFDLWSNGKDGVSSPPLTARPSRDDFVRASNGRFIGPASEFDP